MAATVPVRDVTFEAAGRPEVGRPEPPLELGGYGQTGSDPAGRGRRAVTIPASISSCWATMFKTSRKAPLACEFSAKPTSGTS